MTNPIMQMLNQRTNNPLKMVAEIRQMMNGQNPEAFLQTLESRNPQFADFVNKSKGKTAEQICKEYGLDWNDVKSIL